MTNIRQTASRLTLVALLSAAPVAVFSQTTDTPAADADKVQTEAPADTMSEGAEQAGDAMEEGAEKAGDAAEAAGDAIEEGADSAGDAIEEGAENAGDAMEEGAENADEAMDEAVEDADEMTDEATDGTEPVIDENAPAVVNTQDPVVADQMAEGEEVVEPVEGQIVMQDADTMLANDLIGSSVYSSTGDTIGDINDIIIDLDGTVAGVVIGVGGFLGIGEKAVAIEMGSLSTTQDENGNIRLVASATKEDLKAAAEFMSKADQDAEARAAQPTDGTAVPAPAPAN